MGNEQKKSEQLVSAQKAESYLTSLTKTQKDILEVDLTPGDALFLARLSHPTSEERVSEDHREAIFGGNLGQFDLYRDTKIIELYDKVKQILDKK